MPHGKNKLFDTGATRLNIRCALCDFSVNSPTGMRLHIKKNHSKEADPNYKLEPMQLYCPDCKKKMRDQTEYRNHIKSTKCNYTRWFSL